MPTPDGPLALSAALNLSAITSNACSHETAVNSPSLAKPPSRIRSSGVVSRSAPYMILERK
jgi:hypothetical protein